ncbi:hypothetical protein Bca52824_020630 [Brassica carinata]|uniref:PPIase cyclophilin-type domain-containing protein n=1 Tax=Brassica carinata TaxID=52824 RepID=A0A8X7VSW9_BRACI|nr:hypothetical protein Bca52824_020630 [Brassica carinata]
MVFMRELSEFDDQCVVFGQIVEGLDVITSIMEEVGNTSWCRSSKPGVITLTVKVNTSVLEDNKRYAINSFI